jgi:hypothetical protein
MYHKVPPASNKKTALLKIGDILFSILLMQNISCFEGKFLGHYQAIPPSTLGRWNKFYPKRMQKQG